MSPDEIAMVRTIERTIGQEIPRISVPGYDFGRGVIREFSFAHSSEARDREGLSGRAARDYQGEIRGSICESEREIGNGRTIRSNMQAGGRFDPDPTVSRPARSIKAARTVSISTEVRTYRA